MPLKVSHEFALSAEPPFEIEGLEGPHIDRAGKRIIWGNFLCSFEEVTDPDTREFSKTHGKWVVSDRQEYEKLLTAARQDPKQLHDFVDPTCQMVIWIMHDDNEAGVSAREQADDGMREYFEANGLDISEELFRFSNEHVAEAYLLRGPLFAVNSHAESSAVTGMLGELSPDSSSWYIYDLGMPSDTFDTIQKIGRPLNDIKTSIDENGRPDPDPCLKALYLELVPEEAVKAAQIEALDRAMSLLKG